MMPKAFAYLAGVLEQKVLASAAKGMFQFLVQTIDVQRFDGTMQTITRVLYERSDSASNLILNLEAGTVTFTEQFRPGAFARPWFSNGWIWELAAGIIDEGEDGAETAIREALEETGLIVEKVTPLWKAFVSAGGTSEIGEVFVAYVRSDDKVAEGGGLGSEDIMVREIKVRHALALLDQGKFQDTRLIAAMYWLKSEVLAKKIILPED
jgi:ADP-ribose pyrophosphatase